ncbi:Sporulation initiation inhibitor protein Soj [Nymphon striatum]|nr:Sporulation initiation inhibitor protein Soj [Nymphon striatum]
MLLEFGVAGADAQARDLPGVTLGEVDQVLRNFNPEYLSEDSDMYQALVKDNEMLFLGLDLARTPLEVVGDSIGSAIPYLLMVAVVAFLGWYQQRQIAGRSSGEISSQQQMIMKIIPWMLPIFSFTMPAGLILYFIVSSLLRIVQQAYLTRAVYGDEELNAPIELDDDDDFDDDDDDDATPDNPLAGLFGGGAKTKTQAGTSTRHGSRRPVSETSSPRQRTRPPQEEIESWSFMEWIVTTARSVDEAQTRALDLLGVDLDDAEIQVVEEGKTGLFGRTKSEARVRARIKPKAPPVKEERGRGRNSGGGGRNQGGGNNRNRGGGGPKGSSGSSGSGGRNQGGGNNRNRGGNSGGKGNSGGGRDGNRGGESTAAAAVAADGGGESTQNTQNDGGRRNGGGRDGGRDGGGRNQGGGNNRNRGGGRGRDGGGRDGGRGRDSGGEDRVEMPVDEQRETLEAFVSGVAVTFDSTAKVTLVEEGTTLRAEVTGDNLGHLIGNKASTLQTLEELARTAMHRAAAGRRYHRIQVDVDNYRGRRREALARFATDIAESVAASGVSKAMEPMGAADRKLIHDAVAEVAGVETISEGRDPRRYIVILPLDVEDRWPAPGLRALGLEEPTIVEDDGHRRRRRRSSPHRVVSQGLRTPATNLTNPADQAPGDESEEPVEEAAADGSVEAAGKEADEEDGEDEDGEDEDEEPAPEPRVQRPLPRIMAVANQKGGVGKTTTTVNLAACLAEQGFRTLLVDLDPQANASTGLGLDPRSLEHSVYHVMLHNADADSCIEPTEVKNLFVLPSSLDLAGAEIELVAMMSREHRLRMAIESVIDDYDYVLIDCPPSLGLLTVNALTAAKEVLVPIQCEYYALEGLGQLMRNVELVKANLNPKLEISHIVLVMFDPRTKLAGQVVDEVRGHFGDRVCANVIPRTVRLSEAPSSMAKPRQGGLGRGLGALIPSEAQEVEGPLRDIPVGDIVPNSFQPRRTFDEEALVALSASIRELGVLQPILVRAAESGGFELIAGERRWRAAKRAGLDRIPAIVREVDDETSLAHAIVENVQRAELNAIEEAAAFQQLIDEFNLTQDDVAYSGGAQPSGDRQRTSPAAVADRDSAPHRRRSPERRPRPSARHP